MGNQWSRLYQDAAMLSKPDALKALRACFKKERVVMLPDITAVLGTRVVKKLIRIEISTRSRTGAYFNDDKTSS
jgi:hypothetical protein